MAVTIKLKNASGSDPSASDLVVGEVALRTDSGKLFTKKDDGSVAQIGGGAGSIDDDAVTTAKIADGAVTNAKVATDAAIALSKLATGTLPSGLKVNHNNLQTGIIENENISSSAAIAGSKISPTFTSNFTATGTEHKFTSGTSGDCELIIEADTDNNNENDNPRLLFRQDGGIDASCVENGNNKLIISNSISSGGISFKTGTTSGYTNATERLSIAGDGTVDVAGNLDVGAGIDCTGEMTSTGSLTFSSDDDGIFTFGGGRFYKKSGTGLMIRLHDANTQLQCENNSGTVLGTYFHSGNDGAGSGLDADLLDGQHGSYYTNASNISSGTLAASRVATLNQDTTGNAATATALETARTIAGVSFDGSANISLNNNAITNGAGYITATLTNEQVQDIVGGMVSGNTESGITVTYQDGDGTLDFSVASQTDQNFTTTLKNKLDGIASGATNVTNNNQLTNGAGYITSVSGQNYNSLSNLPTIPSNNNQLSNGAGYITSVSGQNYNSLSNLPTIPSNNNQLSNGAGYITSSSNRAAQAWVNFRGNSTVIINDDANISSVSDNGTGNYTVNFQVSMPNSSYCVSVGFMDDAGNANCAKIVDNSLGTGSFQIRTGSFQDGSGNTDRDFDGVFCSIFAG